MTDTTNPTRPDDGGPAFPASGNDMGKLVQSGATLWDTFFKAAAQGMIAGLARRAEGMAGDCGIIENRPLSVAEISATYADAMLAERKKRFGGEG